MGRTPHTTISLRKRKKGSGVSASDDEILQAVGVSPANSAVLARAPPDLVSPLNRTLKPRFFFRSSIEFNFRRFVAQHCSWEISVTQQRSNAAERTYSARAALC
jgi:hypothetical protein